MNASDTTITRRVQYHPGYALIETLIDLMMSGGRTLSRLIAAFAESRRRAQARYELQRLSDRSLKDIGLARSDIDGLFR